MKKAYLFVLALCLSTVTHSFANTYTDNLEKCPPTDGKRVLCSESNLMARKSLVTGTVSIYVVDETIMVKFQANGNYALNETHLFAGAIDAIPMNANGSPNLAAFPNGGTHANGTRIVTYDIDIATLDSRKIAIAAYSKVKGITYETSWAGNIPLKGSNDATYYEFDLDACSL